MRSIFLNGPSKGGKTTNSHAIADDLGRRYSVRAEDAGQFFRRMTAASLDLLQKEDFTAVPDDALDGVLAKVLANGTAYEPDYPWGDLGRPNVEDVVSLVGRRPIAQAASTDWGANIIRKAAADNVDVLILNARNPRRWLAGVHAGLCLELVVQCEPQEAGRRQAAARGFTVPTQELIEQETAKVVRRRELDASRRDHPYSDPPHMVPYNLDWTSLGAVRQSWLDARDGLPLPIQFDTTHMSFDRMKLAAQGLAWASLAHAM